MTVVMTGISFPDPIARKKVLDWGILIKFMIHSDEETGKILRCSLDRTLKSTRVGVLEVNMTIGKLERPFQLTDAQGILRQSTVWKTGLKGFQLPQTVSVDLRMKKIYELVACSTWDVYPQVRQWLQHLFLGQLMNHPGPWTLCRWGWSPLQTYQITLVWSIFILAGDLPHFFV